MTKLILKVLWWYFLNWSSTQLPEIFIWHHIICHRTHNVVLRATCTFTLTTTVMCEVFSTNGFCKCSHWLPLFRHRCFFFSSITWICWSRHFEYPLGTLRAHYPCVSCTFICLISRSYLLVTHKHQTLPFRHCRNK